MFVIEAFNTVNANWFVLLLAKTFGTYRIYYEQGYLITVSEFRGKAYLINRLVVEE